MSPLFAILPKRKEVTMHRLALVSTVFIFLLSFGSSGAAQSPLDLSPLADTPTRLVVFEGFYRPT